ncbi:hypothetical protein DPMN_038895 [Dreissena polymorpha]|uniref:Uncharacterized protein n=1 Tax=Dreissena polymorpha TaxID=45954 RepID=A0A9D4RP37_DREPO|nr:hypothetical protein DPMN_038895 [Dreissena polymorpha]
MSEYSPSSMHIIRDSTNVMSKSLSIKRVSPSALLPVVIHVALPLAYSVNSLPHSLYASLRACLIHGPYPRKFNKTQISTEAF